METGDSAARRCCRRVLRRRADRSRGHQRHDGEPRSRDDERSSRRDRTRRVQSGHRRVRAGIRSGRPGIWRAGGLADQGGRGGPGGPGGPRRAWRSRRRTRRLRHRRTRPRAERVQRPVELLVRRLGARQRALSAAAGIIRAAETVLATGLRGHGRRARCESPDSTTATGGRISRRTTPATAAAISSISTRRCRPTAMRAGDFSSISTAADRSGHRTRRSRATRFPHRGSTPASLALLRFIPLPNLDGTSRNFHYVTTNASIDRQREPSRDAQLHAERGRTRRAGRARRRGRRARRSRRRPAGRPRTRAAGHERQHDGAAAVPAQRQRAEQRVPALGGRTRVRASRCRSR